MSELKTPYDEGFESSAIDFADLVLGDHGLKAQVGQRGQRNPQVDTLDERAVELLRLAYREMLAGFQSAHAEAAREFLLESCPREEQKFLALEGASVDFSDEADAMRATAVSTLLSSGKFAIVEGKNRLIIPLDEAELKLLKAGLHSIRGMTSMEAQKFRVMAALSLDHHPDLVGFLLDSIVGMETEREKTIRRAIFETVRGRAQHASARMEAMESRVDWKAALTTQDFLIRNFREASSTPLLPYGGVIPQELIDSQAELEQQHTVFASVIASEAGIMNSDYRNLVMRRLASLASYGEFATLGTDEIRISTVRDNIVGYDAIFAASLREVYNAGKTLIARRERRTLQTGFCLGLRGLPFESTQSFLDGVFNVLDHSCDDNIYWQVDRLKSSQGDDSEPAWIYRDTCLDLYSNIPMVVGSVARSLAGLHSARAWDLRKELRGIVQPEELLLSVNNAVIATLNAQGRFEERDLTLYS